MLCLTFANSLMAVGFLTRNLRKSTDSRQANPAPTGANRHPDSRSFSASNVAPELLQCDPYKGVHLATRALVLAAALVACYTVRSQAASPPEARVPFYRASATNTSATSFSFCGGALQLELDAFGDRTGVWTVFGWSYLYYNSHSAALRVDGDRIYSTNTALALVTRELAADPVSRTARIVQDAPGFARVTTLLRARDGSGCCSINVETQIENIDSVEHSFEWRWFHDTAFKEYTRCPPQPDPDVDGGELCLPGEVPEVSCRLDELDALTDGGIGCGSYLRFHSSDTGDAGPAYVLDDRLNPPVVAEVLRWEHDAWRPDRRWSGFVNGELLAGCSGDNAILLAWRVPASGRLLPGEAGGLRFAVGNGCAPDCCSVSADAGPGHTICEGQSTRLGGSRVAIGGDPPYSYRWSPDDGSLSSIFDEAPIATPFRTTVYEVEVIDANGCASTAQVEVRVTADTLPPSIGNTLRGIEHDSDHVSFSWASVPNAHGFALTSSPDKSYAAPIAEALDLVGTSVRVTSRADDLRLYRAHASSCSGRLGP